MTRPRELGYSSRNVANLDPPPCRRIVVKPDNKAIREPFLLLAKVLGQFKDSSGVFLERCVGNDRRRRSWVRSEWTRSDWARIDSAWDSRGDGTDIALMR